MKHSKRFIQYTIASGIATLFDIVLIWLLTEFAQLFYLLSATISFILVSSLNYSINYVWTFKGNKARKLKGLLSFTSIGAIGLILTLLIMAFLVEILSVHYLIARVIAAFLVLIWNYTLNRLVTFKD